MAKVVGGIGTSHIPAIGKAIGMGLYEETTWKPFFDGYKPVHEWLDRVRPDVAVVVMNDHGLNFFLDNMPTFAIGAAAEYENADEGWGLNVVPSFPGAPEFSWHVIESLVADEFDISTCQEMLVDHGFTVAMSLLWPKEKQPWPVRTVPISVNTVQFPLPSPARCYKLGQALGRAIESFDEDLRVVVIGSGGLSHQLDGTRAGFLNRDFDLICMEKIVNDPEALIHYSIPELVRLSGAQGVEVIQWLVMRGAMTGRVSRIHSRYHGPISNTAAALMLLENLPELVPGQKMRTDALQYS
jgi:protocatechuate 4,5-dioxygenase beta chain